MQSASGPGTNDDAVCTCVPAMTRVLWTGDDFGSAAQHVTWNRCDQLRSGQLAYRLTLARHPHLLSFLLRPCSPSRLRTNRRPVNSPLTLTLSQPTPSCTNRCVLVPYGPYLRCLSLPFPAHSSLPHHSFFSSFSFILLPSLHNPRDHPYLHSSHQRRRIRALHRSLSQQGLARCFVAVCCPRR